MRNHCQLNLVAQPNLVDNGCGWGSPLAELMLGDEVED